MHLDHTDGFSMPLVLGLLRSLDCGTVEITYTGSGDSGSIEYVALLRGDRTRLPRFPQCEAVVRFLEDWVYDLLPSGWEINDGSSGTLTIDVASGNVEHIHNEYYTTCRQETTTFKLTEN